jgi:glycosyltransferase involved in cell wall biosynthesis
MTGRIIFIDSTNLPNLNHVDIKYKAIGASEHQFYSLIGEFSKLNLTIVCYNNVPVKVDISNVQYKNINLLKDEIFLNTDKIIVQRLCNLIPKAFEKTNIFVWFHDKPCEDVVKFTENQSCHEALYELHKRKNIHFIFNSFHCKEIYFYFFSIFGVKFQDDKYTIIYNIMYEDDLLKIKNKDLPVNINKLVFGSAWMKGIHKIVDLFRYMLKKNNDLQLVLLSPGYDYTAWGEYKMQIENEFKSSVQVLGPLDKVAYGEVIKTALCVLAPSFFETFGCVFAESYYLGTPVICDVRSGAVKEIIDNNFVTDYSNPQLVLELVLNLQNIRNDAQVSLDDKFLLYENLLLWKKTVLLCNLMTY